MDRQSKMCVSDGQNHISCYGQANTINSTLTQGQATMSLGLMMLKQTSLIVLRSLKLVSPNRHHRNDMGQATMPPLMGMNIVVLFTSFKAYIIETTWARPMSLNQIATRNGFRKHMNGYYWPYSCWKGFRLKRSPAHQTQHWMRQCRSLQVTVAKS